MWGTFSVLLASVLLFPLRLSRSVIRGRESTVWKKNDQIFGLSKRTNIHLILFSTEIRIIKNKNELVSSRFTCWIPSSHSFPHWQVIMIYSQLCWKLYWYIYKVIIFSNRYLLWAQQLPPLSLYTLACIHTTDLYFPTKLLFPFLIRMSSEHTPLLRPCTLPL